MTRSHRNPVNAAAKGHRRDSDSSALRKRRGPLRFPVADFTKNPTGVPGPVQCTHTTHPRAGAQQRPRKVKGREGGERSLSPPPGEKGGMSIHHHPCKKTTREGTGEPEHTDLQTTKSYINVRLGFHIEI